MTTQLDADNFAVKLVEIYSKHENAKNPKTREKYYQECVILCQQKQNDLRDKGYSEITIIKSLTSQYRKAIAKQAGKFDESIKGGYRYTEYPMAFWKINQETRQDIDNITKSNTSDKKEDAIRITPDCREALINLANELLEAPMIEGRGSGQLLFKKALAIALLTGRRFYVEVLRNADFGELETVTNYNCRLGFTGQAKGGQAKSEQLYKIPTYAENIDLLIENHDCVQTFVKSKSWYSDELSAGDFQSRIKKECELALGTFQSVCMEYGFLITIKDLRAIYAALSYYDACKIAGKRLSDDIYLGSVMGHDEQSSNGKKYYKVSTTEHYKGFIDSRLDNF